MKKKYLMILFACLFIASEIFAAPSPIPQVEEDNSDPTPRPTMLDRRLLSRETQDLRARATARQTDKFPQPPENVVSSTTKPKSNY